MVVSSKGEAEMDMEGRTVSLTGGAAQRIRYVTLCVATALFAAAVGLWTTIILFPAGVVLAAVAVVVGALGLAASAVVSILERNRRREFAVGTGLRLRERKA